MATAGPKPSCATVTAIGGACRSKVLRWGRRAPAELSITNNPKWGFAGLGDLNGDGNDDILLRHRDGRWHHYPMDGSGPIRGGGRLALTSNLAWQFVALGDINGDGSDDILLRHVNGRWRYYAVSGSTILNASGSLSMTPNLQWGFVGLGDFNGDGTDDVLLRHEEGRWFQYPFTEGAVLSGEGAVRLTQNLAWSTTGPEPPLDGSGASSGGTPVDSTVTADEVFASSVSSQVVQAKCIGCHVAGGPSSNTRLVLVRSTAPDHVNANRQVFEDFVRDVDDGANVLLNKVQGASGHGGGVQLIAGSTEFEGLRRFVALLGRPGAGAPSITPADLFAGVRIEPARSTLRRAALIFAGRNPTETEYEAIKPGGLARLRATIRGLMQGPEFHEFLIRAANDRLLTDREHWLISRFGGPYVAYVNERYRRAQEAGSAYAPEVWRWDRAVQWAAKRAPLELIAHVAEADRPYTEILTAPYTMANPQAALAYGATTVFGSDDPHDFQPTQIESYYRPCEGMERDNDEQFGRRVLHPGPCATDFPHAGVLNTKVFLQRYPTTATNRNRARSRWTYYHFLGVDIEASAARTTDPDALADTDNPTLHNPACTVCHAALDPVAGAFQDYGNEGRYRDRWGGMHALDWTYITGEPPFQVPIAAASWDERDSRVVDVGTLEAGRQEIQMASSWIHAGGNRYGTWLVVDRVVLRDPEGGIADEVELESTDGSCGDHTSERGAYVWSRCTVAVDVPKAGSYTLEVTAHRNGRWYVCPQAGGDCHWNDQGPPAGRLGLRVAHFYREGDTWYRGMRAPGFAGAEPRRDEDSMIWLAKRIVKDLRFAESVVKFWWPAIMGREVELPPHIAGDASFSPQLLRASAQSLEVARLAGGFRRGVAGGPPHNLKDLLVELVLSKWFRAHTLDGAGRLQRAALDGAGARRLLTPEELARKTEALTGFRWGRTRSYDASPGQEVRDALTGEYRLLYGGIDSDGVSERATDMTSVMLGVAESHAVESSCPIVLRELFLLPDGKRRLFNGIDDDADPSTSPGEAAIRDKLVQLYRQLMGLDLKPRSRDVDAAFALFERVWRNRRTSPPAWFFSDRSCDYHRDLRYFDGILDDAVVLTEDQYTYDGEEVTYHYWRFDWDRINDHFQQVNPRDNGAASAWIAVLAYLMTDYRYLYL